jgi:hypothetical protein
MEQYANDSFSERQERSRVRDNTVKAKAKRMAGKNGRTLGSL